MKSPRFDNVLIATVGHTQEPLQYSLAQHEPRAAIFIASQDTLGTVAHLKAAHPNLHSHTLILEDAESLTEAYKAARKAYVLAKRWEAASIVADLSGGTKPMTAGVALALSGLGITFSYVGGERRDEHGRVVSGGERLRLLEDPTVRFHELEWRSFRNAWNAWRMGSAADALKQILRNASLLGPSEIKFYNHLLLATEGLETWDRFHHSQALEKIKQGLPIALAIAEAWRHGAKARVLTALEEQRIRLEQLVDKAGYPTYALLADLLANADRRADARRYDDALARLYRALELAAEADLYERTGIVLANAATWPDGVQSTLERGSKKLFGLQAVLDLIFDVDVQLGNQGTLAQRLRTEKMRLGEVLQKRHRSILAHGTEPVSKEDYEAFRSLFTRLDLKPAPKWPKW